MKSVINLNGEAAEGVKIACLLTEPKMRDFH